MDLWIDTSELDALAVDLLLEVPKVTKGAQTAAGDSLDATKDTARAVVPVLTGELQGSITVDMDSDGLGGAVGPEADHGGYVEYGTSTMAPQPYMGPGSDAGERVLVTGAEKVADGVLK